MSDVTLRFLGAANTVTGSRYLLQDSQRRWLVDCGLFQGYKFLRQRNWRPFPIEPSTIDAVFLTHAHIDHSGYLPVLAAKGFKGPVYCTEATRDLCKVLLLDAGHLQEEEARYLNKHKLSKHEPAEPLFTKEDAERALELLQPVSFARELELPGGSACFHPNGHILGSASLSLNFAGRRFLFSGDLGRPNDWIMQAPAAPVACDYLVVESTYGDREHNHVDVLEKLADIIGETARRGGTVLIPSFAVGRAQTILYALHQLIAQQRIPKLPIYLDSPMAIKATELFRRHHNLHRLNEAETEAICDSAHYVRTVEQSIALNTMHIPKIVISASGMATGGRVLHHLKNLVEDHANAVIFAGYQAGGTRGARLVNGETRIKIHGRYYQVRAPIFSLDSLSAHADYHEVLHWLRQSPAPPKQVFVTHGEPEAADAMRLWLQEELGWAACVPDHGEEVIL